MTQYYIGTKQIQAQPIVYLPYTHEISTSQIRGGL
jgi:hypothetical protein